MKDVDVRGVLFTYVGETPHTRRDGTVTRLFCWRKWCEHPGCVESWDFKTPTENPDGTLKTPEGGPHASQGFLARLCRWHRPKNPRKRRTRAGKVKGAHPGLGKPSPNRRLSEADVAEMRTIAAESPSPFKSRQALYNALALIFPVSAATAREIVAGRKR